MVLLEVEQKFCWTAKTLHRLQHNHGQPSLKSMAKFKDYRFQDTYFDSHQRLSDNGLWVRKRKFLESMSQNTPTGTTKWEAKQMKQGGFQLRSTFEETEDVDRIAQMVSNYVPGYASHVNDFALDKICQFETRRRSFLADGKFTVVLDETDFGHHVGEVELMAEDTSKAHRDIDAFMEQYAWFFDKSNPKGKLTAYFEMFGFPKEDEPVLWPSLNPLFF